MMFKYVYKSKTSILLCKYRILKLFMNNKDWLNIRLRYFNQYLPVVYAKRFIKNRKQFQIILYRIKLINVESIP